MVLFGFVVSAARGTPGNGTRTSIFRSQLKTVSCFPIAVLQSAFGSVQSVSCFSYISGDDSTSDAQSSYHCESDSDDNNKRGRKTVRKWGPRASSSDAESDASVRKTATGR